MSTSSSAAGTRDARSRLGDGRRVLRGPSDIRVDGHAFEPVSELPSLKLSRPAPTGDRVIDAVRGAAWDEGLAAGFAEGRESGYEAGFAVGHQAGTAAGHAEGLARGQADAAEVVRSEVRTALDALGAAAADLASRDAIALDDIERTVVDLAVDLAAAILEREAAVAADPGSEAIRRALRLAPEKGALVVRLHPADVARLAEVDDVATGREVVLVSDPTIGPGGCLVETESAQVDARVEAALERARSVLHSSDVDEGLE